MHILTVSLFLFFTHLSESNIYPCTAKKTCGCSSKVASASRIVGGTTTNIKFWPWTVSMQLNGRELCSGVILSSEWILTAAHCAFDVNASEIVVHAGSTLRWSNSQMRNVSSITLHPDFDQDVFVNDIALLKLSSPLDMTNSSLVPICLPSVDTTSMDVEEWPKGKTPVTAVGWGRLRNNGPWSNKLQEVNLKVIDNRSPSCKSVINNQRYQLCAGIEEGGKDTCSGDSGGPLMMLTKEKQWILVGLTSSGIGCALKGFAGIYTRVAVYHDWIRSNTNATYANVSKNFLIVKKSSEFLVSSNANPAVSFHGVFWSILLYILFHRYIIHL